VTVYDDCVLKCEAVTPWLLEGIAAMRWSEGKIPVPKILCHVVEDDVSYLLMEKMEGVMACSESLLKRPEVLTRALADGIRLLWGADTAGCPRTRTLPQLLEEARYNIDHGRVDMDNVQPETFGENGFRNPEDLLKWLIANPIPSEPVLSHGDYCLPNVFVKDGRFRGYIDTGDLCIGEKWRDIALCYRSLRDNLGGVYGGKVYDFDPNRLFDALEIEPDWEKIRYHLLLDELF
jgi:kanamycin kinase/aminoglycoside 3'-phosphotransferase-3